ncbi:hypothetical protein N9I65_02215 [bacterium]|nr:hypothetical protein [bacterium]
MEALDEPILPGASGIDVERLDPGIFQPGLQLSVDKLTRFARPSGCLRQSIFAALRFASVVATNVFGNAVNIDQSLELSANIAGADTPIHMDDMVLAGWSSHPNWPIGNVSPGGFVSGVKRSFRERLTTSELRGAPPPGIFVFGPASPMASVSALSPASTVVSRRMAR